MLHNESSIQYPITVVKRSTNDSQNVTYQFRMHIKH